MAAFKYFCDLGGETIELKNPFGMPNKEVAAKFPELLSPVWRAIRYDGYTMWAGYPMSGAREPRPVTRKIEYKSQPSRHECNAKCLGGKATGICECKCGGQNHGRGMFTKMLVGSGVASRDNMCTQQSR